MGNQDVVEALSRRGRFEDGALAAVRGEPSHNPQLGDHGTARPGPVGRRASVLAASPGALEQRRRFLCGSGRPAVIVAAAAGLDVASLGAWMAHGSFSLNAVRAVDEEIESDTLHALAPGNLTDRPLTGAATWLGIMVGPPTAGDDRGDRLVGTAALNYDMDAGGLDAAFSGIRNIDRGMAHGVETVTFSDLAVQPDGTFARGGSGTRIQGGFYGPGHAEAAGIFEQSDIVGAFGAKRQ